MSVTLNELNSRPFDITFTRVYDKNAIIQRARLMISIVYYSSGVWACRCVLFHFYSSVSAASFASIYTDVQFSILFSVRFHIFIRIICILIILFYFHLHPHSEHMNLCARRFQAKMVFPLHKKVSRKKYGTFILIPFNICVMLKNTCKLWKLCSTGTWNILNITEEH